MEKFHAAVQKFSEDPVAWSRVQEELKTAHDRRARFVELAREHGIVIDVTELDQGVLAASKELKDDELESVSGGTNPGPPNLTRTGTQQILIGLLLPAVLKVY